MLYKIVHIVSSLDRINYGIWNAALFGAHYLQVNNIVSVLWVCSKSIEVTDEIGVPVIFIGEHASLLKKNELITLLNQQDSSTQNTLIVTHGSWGIPTLIGSRLKKEGYKWIYTPHGMLEPWSMKHKRLKKEIYFRLFERRWSHLADVIRAVSETEKANLGIMFKKKIILIENGLDVPVYENKPHGISTFLFMARLHFKKGIFPLVMAWNKTMKKKPARLIIAGPDEGELEKIKPYLSDSIQYVGAVYKEEKIRLLRMSHYYVLPSYSEGFPTSVVEAMGYGLIPLISEGCNFQSVFANNLGYQVEPEENSISNVLERLSEVKFNEVLSKENHNFILNHNSAQKIGNQFFELYKNLLTAAR